MGLPDFVIAGAMRCGTTSLYRYLGAHPEVFIAPKELGFFTDHFDRGIDWYRDQFSQATPVQRLGEATADYLARNSAMERLAATAPGTKVIASLRNPVDRAWSHYLLLKERGKEDRTFAAAIDDELRTIESSGPESPGVIYTLHGLYDVHLERVFRLFPQAQFHASIFERMAADPHTAYRDLCEFIGIDEDFVPPRLGEHVNRYVTFRSLRVRDLGKRLPGPVGRIVARLNTRTDVTKSEMPTAERHRLSEFYAPRIAAVESLIGQPLPEWRS